MSNQLTQTVDTIGKIHFEGNIVPTSWYQHIQTKDGKPDFVAITILADIVYWYKPTEIRDEESGLVTGYKKKFAADKLQRSYDQLSNQFGISKEQARDACHRLRDTGLIGIEIRHGVRFGNGVICNNVVYMEPIPETILDISYRVKQGGAVKQASPSSEVDTNTVISPEISPSPSISKPVESEISETPEPKRQALLTLEKEFQKFGGFVNPTFIEKFYSAYDGNTDHRAERLTYAVKRMNETRNFFKAIDGYREWRDPSAKLTYSRAARPAPSPKPPPAPPSESEHAAQLAQWKRDRAANGMST